MFSGQPKVGSPQGQRCCTNFLCYHKGSVPNSESEGVQAKVEGCLVVLGRFL